MKQLILEHFGPIRMAISNDSTQEIWVESGGGLVPFAFSSSQAILTRTVAMIQNAQLLHATLVAARE